MSRDLKITVDGAHETIHIELEIAPESLCLDDLEQTHALILAASELTTRAILESHGCSHCALTKRCDHESD